MDPQNLEFEPVRVREIWPPGTVIKGDYIVEKKLGGGGFGSVYLARHRFFGSKHVIKRLHEQFASDLEFVRKFVNEGRAIRRLNECPHVVRVDDMTQSDDGHLILVMEFVPGGDLSDLMTARALTIDEAIEAGRHIALGLKAAHEAGLIHRDIKPQNVMIGTDAAGQPRLKLIDFGLAADHQRNEQTSVMRGGSLGYTAPEQWERAGKHIDGRADLYSLGATLYRLLCGRMPFETGGEIGVWLVQVETKTPPAPITLRPDCPPELSKLMLELLASRPEKRPKDAAAVIARLESIRQLRGSQAQTQRMPSTPPPATLLETRPRRFNWKPPAAVGGLILASVGGWAWLQPRPALAPPPVVITKKEEEPPVVKPQPQPPVKEAATTPATAMKDTKKQQKPEIVTPPQEPPPPTVDHIALGDAARDTGNLTEALRQYREAGNTAKLAALQKTVESDLDDRATGMMDRGQFAEAVRSLDQWLKEFPDSLRMQKLRAKVVRARDSQ